MVVSYGRADRSERPRRLLVGNSSSRLHPWGGAWALVLWLPVPGGPGSWSGGLGSHRSGKALRRAEGNGQVVLRPSCRYAPGHPARAQKVEFGSPFLSRLPWRFCTNPSCARDDAVFNEYFRVVSLYPRRRDWGIRWSQNLVPV